MALFWNLYTHSHLPYPQISGPPEEREASYQHHQCLSAFRFLRTCTKLVRFLLQSKVQHDFGNNYIFLYRMLQIVSKILHYDKTSYNGYFLYSEIEDLPWYIFHDIIITLCLIMLWSSSYILMVSWRHAKRRLNILLNSWPWCKIPCIIMDSKHEFNLVLHTYTFGWLPSSIFRILFFLHECEPDLELIYLFYSKYWPSWQKLPPSFSHTSSLPK